MPRLLTTKQAAEFLSLHPVTVRRKARGGEIPFVRLGGQWRFDEGVLREWIARGCPTAQRDPDLFTWANEEATPAP